MPEKRITIEDILKSVHKLDAKKEALIRSAYEVALKAHTGQKRKSGVEYIQHPLHTALNLAKIGLGSHTISAGLLHDVPEDTETTLEEIEKKFGKEIATLVDGVTKLGKIKLRGTKEELYLENLRKMFLAMASDIRVVLIKLADRLHNMETLSHVPPEKQQRIAMETLEVFAPIANRLGIGEIKARLEDLSFKYLDPENYEEVSKLVKEQYSQRKKYVDKAISELKKELLREGIDVIDIYGRTKHTYSLFQKLKRHDMDINKIYDLVGVRIVVPEVVNCYETLGIVHKKYRPLVGRIKDYISLPKPNGYQSIHTTIFGPEGKFLEVQIRTKKMDDEAEFGIAAHWIYSEKKQALKDIFFRNKKTVIPEKDIAWVRQLREWQNELGKDDQEFMESLKIDFFKNHIFAFTPSGDIIDLPEEANTIDFAYRVHSEVGNRATGAKVNGKMVPLDYKIRNGDVIEILTSRDHKTPSRDWLRFVRTSNAKSHIRRMLKKKGLL
ncbi:MAG: bifunctional (p)ppGpp synthetase/guanosine-3',5'-bis(diphosphate) 3'-pyrophosphohydrolase [Candidatus Moranbacteria bacterium]|nr:bifunctional (p)ppGpp synthetase/guanosine-3',5'-bis(diphosphate) 3'-pyrophosphohydrolase [Candidatus Moranbacteria bacterium]